MNHRCVSRVRGMWIAGRWRAFIGLVGTLLVRLEGVVQAAPERVSGWWEQQGGGWGIRQERVAEVAGGGQIQARPREGSGFDGGTGSATSGF